MVDFTMTQLVEVILWAALTFSFACLIVAIIMDCRGSSESFEKEPSRCQHEPKETAHITDQAILNSRCGPKCQHVHPDKKPWETPPDFYPNLKMDPVACNSLPNKWAAMSPPKSLEYLTKKRGSKRYICNRSCPPQEVACGLPDNGLGAGVMDSVAQAGDLGSAVVVKAQELKETFSNQNEAAHKKKGGPLDILDHMGYVCCDNGKPILNNGAVGTLNAKQCAKKDGNSFTKTVHDCMR